MSLLGPEIVRRLQQAGFSISELRWRVGQIQGPVPRKAKSSILLPLRQLPSELARALSAVQDSELRDAISEAAAHVMALQENALRKRAANVARPIAPDPRCAEQEFSAGPKRPRAA